MKALRLIGALSLVFTSFGCATTGLNTRTGGGWIASFKEVQSVTAAKGGSKRGTACAENILGVTIGDASVETAKRNGGITTVSSVDSEFTNVLLLYGKNCTVVAGE